MKIECHKLHEDANLYLYSKTAIKSSVNNKLAHDL